MACAILPPIISVWDGEMPVFVTMLRGINVGGHNKIKMETLRALFESLGHSGVQTHIQSGNIVFQAKAKDSSALSKRVGDAIEHKFGFRPGVVVRNTAELRSVIARNPFGAQKSIDPSKLLVVFLATDPGHEIREKILTMQTPPEELRIDGSELYIYFPNGMARPKLSLPKIEKVLNTASTGRNWNTVEKLLGMAEKLEAAR
jgi:uncharacterized protein (DUF1697 family)